MSFEDPIAAGRKLIREALESLEYVAGLAGWRIARDGSAEFNSLDVRGEFTSTGGLKLDSQDNDAAVLPEALYPKSIRWLRDKDGDPTITPAAGIVGYFDEDSDTDWIRVFGSGLQVNGGSVIAAQKAGTKTVTTDINGRATWTHGLGLIPSVVLVSLSGPADSGGTITSQAISRRALYTATQVTTRFFANNGATAASVDVAFDYLALGIATP